MEALTALLVWLVWLVQGRRCLRTAEGAERRRKSVGERDGAGCDDRVLHGMRWWFSGAVLSSAIDWGTKRVGATTWGSVRVGEWASASVL